MSSKKKSSLSCRGGSRSNATTWTYENVVRDYIAEYRRRANIEIRWFAARADLQTVVDLAAMCRTPDNKRHPHQHRLPESVLRAAHAQLAICDLQTCESFEDLHDRIDVAIGQMPGIGELAVYDIAYRIGAFLHLEPERIYLHRGTKVGANALGLGHRQVTIEVDDLPSAFWKLKPREIEDCLCIYSKELEAIRDSTLKDD